MTDPTEPGSEGDGDEGDDGALENDGSRFDRLPPSAEERRVTGRPTREEVLDWWADRYGVSPETFAEQSF